MSQAKGASLTPDQSRAARRELAMSQRDVIDQTGVPAYKIKQFEAGSFRPDIVTLKKLRDFYEEQGVDFDELDAYLSGGPANAGSKVVEPTVKSGFTSAPRAGFFISADLPPQVVDKLMTDMEASDGRVADIVKSSMTEGMLGGLSDETEALVQELFGHLAMNHLRFRSLQGRNIIEPMRDEAKTVGGYLAQWISAQGVVIPGMAEAAANGEREDADGGFSDELVEQE